MIEKRIAKIIDGIIAVEGGYVNHPDDPGGATNFGITQAVARANGYAGDMRHLPREKAAEIYYNRYVVEPRFDDVLAIAPRVAAELVDSGVNAGTTRAAEWLQQALNVANRKAADWPDLKVDGRIGPATLNVVRQFINRRGEALLVKLLDAYQARHYLNLAEKNSRFESFIPGWFEHRVGQAA